MGKRLQPAIPPEIYRKLVRAVLWAIAALLLAQAAGVLARR
jgi:hypothetical protein